MPNLLAALLRRLQPREGWLPLLLTLVTALCLPAALLESPSGAAQWGLLVIAALAVVVGAWLARSRLRAAAAALVATAVGGAVALASAARLWLPLAIIWQGPGAIGTYLWQQMERFGLRLENWAEHATTGTGAAQEMIAIELALSLLVWAIGLFTAWQVFRQRSGWAALAPGAITVSLTAFFLGGLARFYFYVYLVAALSLVAVCHLWRQQARWERTGSDFPGSIGADTAMVLAPWLFVVLSLAIVSPVLRISSLQTAFWQRMEGPWTRLETAAERYVGPIDSDVPVPGAGGRGPGRSGGELPQMHLLGGGTELDDTLVFTVSTNDPPPPDPEEGTLPTAPRRYWRRITYDRYTGLGWANSQAEVELVPAGQVLRAEPSPGTGPLSGSVAPLPGSVDLVQRFELPAGGSQLYAANTPYRVDAPVVAHWRAGGDLIDLIGDAQRYGVVSRVPQPTVDVLRASALLADPLPPAIAERYLALPESLPARVTTLAREIVGDARTRYDAVERLERYLRTYPYELDLPEPPENRDLVDYFLFDRQEGYCDYYASALVVMARTVGVPARLATGYAQGTYDPSTHRWVVTLENGHSWPEVYFEGIGWVEFEPTAGQAVLQRPGEPDTAAASAPIPPHPPRWWQRVPWGAVAVVGIVVAGIALLAWLWRPARVLIKTGVVGDRYERLLQWGDRLGQPLRAGQTPGEYGRSLNEHVRARAARARSAHARQAADNVPGDVDELVTTFVQARYSPHPTSQATAWRIHTLWRRLRRHLLSLWLSPPPTS